MDIKCLLLDLDDTLYPERDYFESGLKAVASWLAVRQGLDVVQVRERLYEDLRRNGRNQLFDMIAVPDGVDRTIWIKTLLHVYRSHRPEIRLYPQADKFIDQCMSLGLDVGLVTDGKSRVQWNKVEALGLDRRLHLILCTEDIDTRKPATEPFAVAAGLLNVPVEQCVYVADDPSKDFIGPRCLSMKTIHIKHSLEFPLAHGQGEGEGADFTATGFDEILAILTGGFDD